MSEPFCGPLGVTLPAALLRDHSLPGLRLAVTQTAYAAAYTQVQIAQRANPDLLAFYATACAMSLVPAGERHTVAERVASFPRFRSLPIEIASGVATLAGAYEERLRASGWDAAQRREALKGLACALMALAHAVLDAPTINHIDPAPSLRSAGFPPLIDRLVFGLEGADQLRAVDVEPDAPLIDPVPVATVPSIASMIEQWLGRRDLSASEQSRRGSSAKLFLVAADLSVDEPLTALAAIDAQAGAIYARLSDAVGSKWGTIASSLTDKTATEIIAIATTRPIPTWAKHPLQPRGRKARIDHVIDLLAYARELGIAVPNLDFGSGKKGTKA